MAAKKKIEGARKGFSKNPILLLLDLLDTPGNILRGGVKSVAEGENLVDSAFKNLTRQEVTTGVDVNKSLGLTNENTAPLVEGIAGLGTSLGLGAFTVPIETAALGGAIGGIKNIGVGAKEALGLKRLEDIASLAPTSTTQRVGRKVGEGVRKVLSREELDFTTGKKVLKETRLNQLKENKRFSEVFRPTVRQTTQQKKDISALTRGVRDRNLQLQQRINKLNLTPEEKERFKLAMISNINATSRLDDIPRLSSGNILDKFMDSLDIGRGGKDTVPDLSKVGKRQLFSKGIVLNKDKLTPENRDQFQGLIDTINEPLRERTGIENAFSIQESLDGKKLAARLNSKQILPLLRDPAKLQNQETITDLVSNFGGKGIKPEEQTLLFQNTLGEFSKIAQKTGINPGSTVSQVLETLEQFNLKELKEVVDPDILRNVLKLQRQTRKATQIPATPLLEQFQQLSADINVDEDLFKKFGETIKLGKVDTEPLDQFRQLLKADPRLAGQSQEIEAIFTEAKDTLLEARKAASESAKFVGKGKFFEQQAKGFDEGSFIPRMGDFRSTEISRLANQFEVSPELLDRALPASGRFTPEIESITNKLFQEGVPTEQTFALRDEILKNEDLFKEFSGDRGAGKQALEGLVDSFQRIKRENIVLAAEGKNLKVIPEIDINKIIRGQLRGAANNGPEEAAFVNLIRQHGKPFKDGKVFKDGVWQPAQQAVDDITDFVPLNVESLPLQNNKSALWRTKLLQDLGIDPTVAGAKEVLLPKEVHEIVRDIGNGRHLDGVLGLNPLRDRQLFKRMSQRSQGQTPGILNTLGELTGKVMDSVRKIVIATPGYHFRNQFGQVQNMYLSGLSPEEIAKYYPKSLKTWTGLWKNGRKDPAALKELMKNPRLKTYLEVYDRSPITFEQNWDIDPENVLKILKNRTIREVKDGASTTRFGVGKQGALGNIDNILKDNLDLTIATDHASRFAVFDRALDKLQPMVSAGNITQANANKKAIQEASQIVFSRLDLGPGSNDLMRQLFLFSGWTINNTKKVLREISSSPEALRRYMGILRTTKGLQQNLGGEEHLSEFALERGRFSIPLGGKNIEPKVLDSTAIQGLGNVVNPFQAFSQALSPVFKLPIELGTGRNLTTGQEIKSVPRTIATTGLGLQNPLRILDALIANTPIRKGLESQAVPKPVENFFDLSERRNIDSLQDFVNNIPGFLFNIRD